MYEGMEKGENKFEKMMLVNLRLKKKKKKIKSKSRRKEYVNERNDLKMRNLLKFEMYSG